MKELEQYNTEINGISEVMTKLIEDYHLRCIDRTAAFSWELLFPWSVRELKQLQILARVKMIPPEHSSDAAAWPGTSFP